MLTRTGGAIGVYAGQSLSTYVFNIYNDPERVGHIDHMQLLLLNDKDHLTTHVSYKLNLTGSEHGRSRALARPPW